MFVAIVTPFTNDYKLDEEILREEIGFLLDNGVNGLIVNGSTGENLSLSAEERHKIISIVAEEVDGRIPILAGVETIGTKMVVEETRHAKDAGADAAMIVTPTYLKPTEEGRYEHYKIAAEVGLPIVLYNNPFRTGFSFSPPEIKSLTKIDEIIGMKQSDQELSKTAEIIRLVDDRIDIIHSYGYLSIFPGLLLGGKAAVAAAFFIVPERIKELYEAVMKKDVEKANSLWVGLQPIITNLGSGVHKEPNPCTLKEALKIVGRPVGPTRPPLQPISKDTTKLLEKILRDQKVIL